MYRLGFVQNQGGILAGACVSEGRPLHKLKDYDDYNGSDSLLFSLGLDISGESIDHSSSPTSLTNIRYNFTSRHGKERASLGGPSCADECLLSLRRSLQQTSGRGRIRTYVEKLQQIYSLSLLTTRPLSPSRAEAPLHQWVLRRRDKNLK
ncbi:hypothetical protein VNO77_47748 [Canavalia gladiata]|uniref:Uncharacterized protein n=1 Tax=Canavalia gladiata TaxID=3824 RepID=A0AAN9JHE1_CANGL